MHAWSNEIVRLISGAQTENFDGLYQLHILLYQNRSILIIIDKLFNDYSLRSIVSAYAHELSLFPDPIVMIEFVYTFTLIEHGYVSLDEIDICIQCVVNYTYIPCICQECCCEYNIEPTATKID